MPPNLQSADTFKNLNQFSKFLLVGCSNFAVSFAVFFLFYNFWPLSEVFYRILGPLGSILHETLMQLGASSLDATLANILGYSAGIANSFVWNKLWTFKVKHETMVQFGRFIILNISGLIISSASLFVFTDSLEMPYIPVWFFTMAILTVINFICSKYWVFQTKTLQDCSQKNAEGFSEKR